MRTVRFATLSLLAVTATTAPALAQDPPPPPLASDLPPEPPPGPVPEPPAASAPAPVAPAPAAAPPAAAPPATGAAPAGEVSDAGAAIDADAAWTSEPESDADALTASGAPSASDDERQARRESLELQNGLLGSTGLLHVTPAGSAAVGTFRLGLLTSYFSSSGYLCDGDCLNSDGTTTGRDTTSRVGAHLSLSVTPLPYLEAFLGVHSTATANDRGLPELLQVLGDTSLGVKAFTPHEDDSLFSFGGQLGMWLLNGTGNVGLDFSGTGFGIDALATADFTNKTNPSERLPVRVHANLGYLFNNAGELVESTEAARGTRITRIERFGLDIDRVDSVRFGLAGEYVHERVNPFLEWSIDVPSNRQGYTCYPDIAFPNDRCLETDGDFSATPSRLTLGARFTPWVPGLGITAALDVATGGAGKFIEEVSPEAPWNLWLGLGYAIDTVEPPPRIERVEVERVVAPTRRYVTGKVVDAKTGESVPNAILTFQDEARTGMVTLGDGTFRSSDLEPGSYRLRVSAEEYYDGECAAVVPLVAPQPASPEPMGASTPPDASAEASADPAVAGASSAEAGADEARAEIVVDVECQLKALPQVGNVLGSLADALTGQPVASARVTITDKRGRQLELQAGAGGEFRFENVPPGRVTISAAAEGYLPAVAELEIAAREDKELALRLNAQPEKPNVTVTQTEVKLGKQVHFQHDSATILPDSMGLIQEAAQVLLANPELRRVEVQGHTDNTGEPEYNRSLSQRRAEAVRKELVDLGISPERLTARGYGDAKPIVPNTSDAYRARNRRVHLAILERD